MGLQLNTEEHRILESILNIYDIKYNEDKLGEYAMNIFKYLILNCMFTNNKIDSPENINDYVYKFEYFVQNYYSSACKYNEQSKK